MREGRPLSGREGEASLSEGRGKMFSFWKEEGRCSLSGRKGLMSFIWEEGGLDIVTCRERDS